MLHSITIVTAYFPLGDLYPGTARPSSYYLESAKELCKLPLPMIFFVDPSITKTISKNREQFSKQTVIHEMDIKELAFYNHKDLIEANRKTYWPTADSRNTALVHIVTGNKHVFMLRAMQLNPFQTSHFAWIDFGIAHPCRSFVLDNVVKSLQLHLVPKEVRVLAVDDIDADLLRRVIVSYQKGTDNDKNLRDYYSTYRFGISGQFWTCGLYYGLSYSQEVIKIFENHILNGYGHGEEMCLTMVHEMHPDWFQIYYGDYSDTFTNYNGICTNINGRVVTTLDRLMENKHYIRALQLATHLLAQKQAGLLTEQFSLCVLFRIIFACSYVPHKIIP